MSHALEHPEDLLGRERRGGLSAAERIQLDRHLELCAACRLVRTSATEAEDAAAPQNGDDALLARLVSAAGERAAAGPRSAVVDLRKRRSATAMKLVAALVAAAVLASAAVAIAWRTRDRAIPPAPPASASPTLSAPPILPPLGTTGDDPEATSSSPPAPPPSSPASTSAPTVRSTPATDPSRSPALGPEELFREANRQRRLGNDDDAVRRYRELQARFPRSQEAAASEVALGRLMLDKRGDAQAALVEFDGYLARKPPGTLAEEALLGRALALQRLGRADEERATWQRLLTEHPGSIYSERARARLAQLR